MFAGKPVIVLSIFLEVGADLPVIYLYFNEEERD